MIWFENDFKRNARRFEFNIESPMLIEMLERKRK
jgi:hypothetical protein